MACRTAPSLHGLSMRALGNFFVRRRAKKAAFAITDSQNISDFTCTRFVVQQARQAGTPGQFSTFVTTPVIEKEAASLSSTPPVATIVYSPGNT